MDVWNETGAVIGKQPGKYGDCRNEELRSERNEQCDGEKEGYCELEREARLLHEDEPEDGKAKMEEIYGVCRGCFVVTEAAQGVARREGFVEAGDSGDEGSVDAIGHPNGRFTGIHRGLQTL